MTRISAPADLWPEYGRHAAAILRHGPAPDADAGRGWSLALSGAGHVDLNQLAFYGPVERSAVEAVLARVAASDIPALLGQSASLNVEIGDLLRAAGFLQSPAVEALFWAPAAPTPTDAPFQVRRAENRADLARIWSIFVDAHGYEPDLVESMYGEALLDDEAVAPWLALDRGETVSCAFVTSLDQTLGLFDVMTLPRHRRRGAARALLNTALSTTAAEHDEGINGILFWASPSGRPLYELLGFGIADLVTAWTLGASAEDLAAVGAG